MIFTHRELVPFTGAIDTITEYLPRTIELAVAAAGKNKFLVNAIDRIMLDAGELDDHGVFVSTSFIDGVLYGLLTIELLVEDAEYYVS